jgi:hypothetical protein
LTVALMAHEQSWGRNGRVSTATLAAAGLRLGCQLRS